jgi:hypothetical protein
VGAGYFLHPRFNSAPPWSNLATTQWPSEMMGTFLTCPATSRTHRAPAWNGWSNWRLLLLCCVPPYKCENKTKKDPI